MKTIPLPIILCLLVLCLTACSFVPASPTPMPTSTNTLQPTLTPTDTPKPTATPTSTLVPATETSTPPALPNPQGTPLVEWKSIPIMPGAIAGEESDGAYSFTINATVEKVRSYYEKEMAKHEWVLWGAAEGKTGSVILIFANDLESCSIAIMPENPTMVIIVR